MASKQPRLRIGEHLIKAGKLTTEQLINVLGEQKKTGLRFGQAMISLGYITDIEFADFLANLIGVPFVDLSTFEIPDELGRLLREEDARRLGALPISETTTGLLVGMLDPQDIMSADELSRMIPRKLRIVLIVERQFLQALDKLFSKSKAMEGLVQELGEELDRHQVDLHQFVRSEAMDDAPVVRLLQTLFEDAVRMNASDIHIEPGKDVLRIRKRIDGVLHEQLVHEKQIAAPLISKLKLMGGLEISEKRLPQDGRFNMRVHDDAMDVRISTLPIQYGESVVMRLLNKRSITFQLDRMGFPGDIAVRMRRMLHHPHGIILVTGPTGSGKSSTLYAALTELNEPGKKILTVEDPVEYQLDRINQVQVNPKIGLTFASVLRSMLRQDPDILLVGEIRDLETAEIAIRAALTGHMVLSSLHTNDAPSTAVRLMEMGVKGYAVASSLLGVLSQRLIRKVCAHCARPYHPTVQERAWILANGGDPEMTLVQGAGCRHCLNSGYQGRMAVAELFEMKQHYLESLSHEDTNAFLASVRQDEDFVSLPSAGLSLAAQKLTTIEEVFRLAGESTMRLSR
ncbi:MAG: Flp pilus assembly complex ATPase component TadA [Magnetococcales bacterium]|nr:Flp pilus assembly complex ATPase component TadA [Magnetococcales bacterium]NGZ27378.1 Flp pilus assembly complex ATPase component TadA [Magnetococcales bacterium]